MVLAAIAERFLHEDRLPEGQTNLSFAKGRPKNGGLLAPGQRRTSVLPPPMFLPPNISSNPTRDEMDVVLTVIARVESTRLR